ncbi:MAG: hypothetical protein E7813_22075 [Bradyrhizobium sp.]|uniref:hypothetical protein n=1 Tax=Bradyrhizobium sp. TaxID=376 RepID=UPI0012257C87|nr:hypothetical protein [Bradyrhizobium sp.]THD61136.1 MAG: hypothetical protein E7813_22075 [Bradyrhizobium sp.]
MIFEQTRNALESQNRSAGRYALVEKILGIFRTSFPELNFRILDRVTAVNAQASILDNVRSVNLFGGLAYHPEIGRDALVFILLHETGHHLSRGCRLPWMRELACDCAADCWAVTEGQAQLQKNNSGFAIEPALSQIESAANLKSRVSVKAGRPACSFLNWTKRKRRLMNAKADVRDACGMI